MSFALTKESFFWHKLHSLTGIIPVGFYLLQHLALNTFSLAGPEKYNGVSGFFYSMPGHILLTIEVVVIWVPLLFHAVYGLFITNRMQQNYVGTKYKWSQNRMYLFQRITGMFIFVFLIYHVITTTGKIKIEGSHEAVDYNYMASQLWGMPFYWVGILYLLGVLATSYHLSFGVWNFCIRWGITISDKAQLNLQRFATGMFIAVTLLGWAALFGFLIHKPSEGGGAISDGPISVYRQVESPTSSFL